MVVLSLCPTLEDLSRAESICNLAPFGLVQRESRPVCNAEQAFVEQAQAANEVSELAAGDNRLLILTVIFVPALGWVAFNILGPALNQLANMATQNAGGGGKKGGKKGGRR